MVFYTLFLQLYLKNGQKTERWCLSNEKKAEEKQNHATIMISVNRKGTIFTVYGSFE